MKHPGNNRPPVSFLSISISLSPLPEGVKLIGITGTNGKTTTTSLTYKIVKKAFPDKTFLAGNIG